jgi:hypothetical protein
MVSPDKQTQALRALQIILVRARAMAYEQKADDLAKLLDWAEIFPFLIGCDRDETATVRSYLEAVVKQFPGCVYALAAFDSPTPPEGWA